MGFSLSPFLLIASFAASLAAGLLGGRLARRVYVWMDIHLLPARYLKPVSLIARAPSPTMPAVQLSTSPEDS